MASTLRCDRWLNTAGSAYNNILQIVEGAHSGQITVATGSYPNYEYPYTSLATTITPRRSTSKILIMLELHYGDNSTGSWQYFGVRSSMAGNQIAAVNTNYDHAQYGGGIGVKPLMQFDNSSTIVAGSPITYTPFLRNDGYGNLTYYINWAGAVAGTSTLHLLEIAQ